MQNRETITIYVDRLQLLTFEGYFRIYYDEYYPRDEFEGNHNLAYQAIEKDYYSYFKTNKYTSYDSFRRSKYAYLERSKANRVLK